VGKLLFDEVPVVVSKELSVNIGLNEAIVLQQVYYWVEINKKANRNFREGRYWVYNSIKAWHEDNFDYWSSITVKRTFSKLEDMGLLLSANFNSDPRDNTKWYTVDIDAVDALKNKSRINKEGMSQPLVQNEPAGDMLINEANPIVPLVQNAPMQCIKMIQPLYQNDPARCIKMTQPLPEITTKITTEITTTTKVEIPEKKEAANVVENEKDMDNDDSISAINQRDYVAMDELVNQIQNTTGVAYIHLPGLESVLSMPDGIERLQRAIVNYPDLVERIANIDSPVGFLRFIAQHNIKPPLNAKRTKKCSFKDFEQHVYNEEDLNRLFEPVT